MKNLWSLSSLGLEFAIIIIFGVYLGNFLDDYLQVEPIMLFLSLIISFFSGIYYIIYKTKQ